MEEPVLISFPYITIDDEQQQCEMTIIVDAAKVTSKGDLSGINCLLSDGVLFGPLNLFVIEFDGHNYGSDTMNSAAYIAAVNACCVSEGLGQIITFAQPTGLVFGGAPFALGATASSGLTVTYVSSDPTIISISGGTATIVGAGTATITANQAGNGSFAAATPVAHSVTVAKAAQTITFAAFGSHAHTDAPFALTATASSGLAVTYVSGTPSVSTISGSTLTPVAAGASVITASQAGNANYNAATPVNQTLTLS